MCYYFLNRWIIAVGYNFGLDPIMNCILQQIDCYESRITVKKTRNFIFNLYRKRRKMSSTDAG